MKDQYVILTGSKNNAGDFLIKQRAKSLFAHFRPDRKIVDFDRWMPLTAEQLKVINDSRALILMGGPALQPHMRPHIYPLVENLNEIKSPLIMMGLGYKDKNGSWFNIPNYKLGVQTHELLSRIESDGYKSGVRDYHTLNMLLESGYKNVMMTGCPALYDIAFIGQPPDYSKSIKTVGFSLGVSYLRSQNMNELMKRTIMEIRDSDLVQNRLTVFFHHTIDLENQRQQEMVNWLNRNNIAYQDISGSVDELMKCYSNVDIHVGFRVHAHIYCCSISKPSVLFSEDGRGKGLTTVIGGLTMDAFQPTIHTLKRRIFYKLGLLAPDQYEPYYSLGQDTLANIQYEQKSGYPRMEQTRNNIDLHLAKMKQFLEQLP